MVKYVTLLHFYVSLLQKLKKKIYIYIHTHTHTHSHTRSNKIKMNLAEHLHNRISNYKHEFIFQRNLKGVKCQISNHR